MIDDARFEGRPVAHLRYAACLPLEEARRIIEKYANDRTWWKIPDEWLRAGERLAECKNSPFPPTEFYPWAIELAVKSPLDHNLTQFLIRAVNRLTLAAKEDPTPQLGELALWFTKQASPGHAPMAAALLSSWALLCRTEKLCASGIPKTLVPMAEWLLLNGAAELRSAAPTHPSSSPKRGDRAKHPELLLDLVDTMYEHGRRELLEITLRYLLLARVPRCGWSPTRRFGLWPQVEAALEGGASQSLATDIILRIGHDIAPLRESIWAPLLEPTLYPKASRALFSGLGRGLYSDNVAREAWRFALLQPPPPTLPPFQDRRALLFALDQLRDALPRVMEDSRASCPEAAGWAEHLAEEMFRFFGADGLDPLQRVIGWHKDATAAVEDVLCRTLDSAPTTQERDLALAVLATPCAPHSSQGLRLRAALTALTPSTTRNAIASSRTDLSMLRERLTRFIHHPWLARNYGVPIGALLGGRSSIAFEELDGDDKIRIEDDRIVVDPGFHMAALSAPTDPDRALALCILYFTHELIHLPQGIGNFATVQDVRSTGAEMTLMHLDLGADHCACMLVTEAFPMWDLLWLKDLTGRSLTQFPVSRYSTEAARHRKAARLVSIRLDYLARSSGAVARDRIGDGYLFADYGPAGGSLLVLSSSLPMGLIGSAPLDQRDANVLWRAADPPDRINEVDAILRRVLNQISL